MCRIQIVNVSLMLVYFLSTNRGYSIEGDSLNTREAQNVLYFEVGGAALWGSGSINYERRVAEDLSIRVGYGLMYTLVGPILPGSGPLAAFVYTLGSEHRLESGLGACLMLFNEVVYLRALGETREGPNIRPVAFLGYRYQQSHGGFFFRAGFSFAYYFGTPFQCSLGYMF